MQSTKLNTKREAGDGVLLDGATRPAVGRQRETMQDCWRQGGGSVARYPSLVGDLGDEIQQCRPVLGRLQLGGVEDEEDEGVIVGGVWILVLTIVLLPW